MNPFVILTFPRTGSTYIRLWMHNHSRIRCHGELFLAHYRHADGFWSRNASPRIRFARRFYDNRYLNYVLRKLKIKMITDKNVDDYMRRFLDDKDFPSPWIKYIENAPETVGVLDKPWAGFKLMYSQLEATPRLLHWFRERDFTVLHLVRENLLKQYVSLQRMKTTRVSHATAEGKKVVQVPLNVERMFGHFQRTEQRTEKHRKLFDRPGKYLEFTYERFFSETEAVRKEILDYLGLPDEPMEAARLKKTSTDVLANEVANAEEVRRALENSPYARFLEAYE